MTKSGVRILVLDDEEGMCRLLKGLIEDMGYGATVFQTADKALTALENDKFEAAIVDIKMPQMNGIDFLHHALALDPHLSVVMITAYGNVEDAVDCMKTGAFDYISKPFQTDEIHFAINRILERRELIRENTKLRQEIHLLSGTGEIIGKSSKITRMLDLARKIAGTNYKVLITGESGTGKELMARYIHKHSQRNAKPFLPVQCSLLPENLLESELFGHRKGSFTGAIHDKTGLFEEANGGTLFLDEIGDINLAIQGKLLRFLQEHEIKKIGETKSKLLDVRVISATNKDLEQMVKERKFREDLFYRLKVASLHMPPLRERKEDIVLLAKQFLQTISKELRREITLEKECYVYLAAYSWPGNIRELRNCLESAASLCTRGRIRISDVHPLLAGETTTVYSEDLGRKTFHEIKTDVLRQFESKYLADLLVRNHGNITKSAIEAGMDKKNLWIMLKRNGLDYRTFKS